MVALEHFYYGQLIHYEKPAGNPRVLARSEGISDEQIEAVLANAMIPALPDEKTGSWALVRGGKVAPFIMAQAQPMDAGCVYHHFILLPSVILRDLKGNVRPLTALLDESMPVYEMLGDTLPLVDFDLPPPRTTDVQVDDLLELMNETGNNTRKIEPLLSAVVENVPLRIQNAPADDLARITFIQGLLTLLPSSTRFSVTFATHLEPASDVTAQVAFIDGDPSDDALLYNYESHEISGKTDLNDDYSHFIVGQLRLDAELVIQQAEALTPTAGWRFRSGASLTEALSYASHRSRLDRALSNNMPVDVAAASKVLAEDPTLTDDLREKYTLHIMNMSLAMEEMQHADPIAVTLHTHPSLAPPVLAMLRGALDDGTGYLVFEMLLRWLESPLSPRGPEWVRLLHQSMMQELDVLIEEDDLEGVLEWLDDACQIDPSMQIEPLVMQVVDRLIPLVDEEADLSPRMLVLAMNTLDRPRVQTLLKHPKFVRNLPADIKKYLATLRQGQTRISPGTLTRAADATGEASRDHALVMFAEMAHDAGQLQVFDTPALQRLTAFALSPAGSQHRRRLATIAHTLSEEQALKLKPPGPRLVLQLLLIGDRYDWLAGAMKQQSLDIYGADGQAAYLRMVMRLFAGTPVSAKHSLAGLKSLEKRNVRDMAMLVAVIGSLRGTDWAPEMTNLADNALKQLQQHEDTLRFLHPEVPLTLLQFYIETDNTAKVRETARLIPLVTVEKPDKIALTTINQAYKSLTTVPDLRTIALLMLQQYLHSAPEKPAQRVVSYYSQSLEPAQVERLEMTNQFSVFMGRMDLETWASVLEMGVALLEASAGAYVLKSNMPSHKKLKAVADNMRVRMDSSVRADFAGDLLELGRLIVRIGRTHASQSSTDYKHMDAVLKGVSDPRSIVDTFYATGGFLSRGRHIHLNLKPNTSASPFGDMLPADVQLYLSLLVDILQGALRALPAGKPVTWTSEQVTHEMESRLKITRTPDRQAMVKQLAIDLQKLAELIIHIQREGDNSVVKPDSRIGKRLDEGSAEPGSALEFYRFFAGAFRGN